MLFWTIFLLALGIGFVTLVLFVLAAWLTLTFDWPKFIPEVVICGTLAIGLIFAVRALKIFFESRFGLELVVSKDWLMVGSVCYPWRNIREIKWMQREYFSFHEGSGKHNYMDICLVNGETSEICIFATDPDTLKSAIENVRHT